MARESTVLTSLRPGASRRTQPVNIQGDKHVTSDRRAFLAQAAAVGATIAAPAIGAKETYPSRTVRIISPYPAGGITDILSRMLADKLQRSLGQSVIVEAKAGAGGNLGTAYVARGAKSDPYTLLMGASGPLAPNVTLFKNLGYDPLKDLSPITLVAATPLVVTVPANSAINSFPELVLLLKERGDRVNYGSGGAGTPQHLSVEMMLQRLEVRSTHVPYKGAAPVVNALLAAEVHYAIELPVLVHPHIKAGKLRPLAVTSRSRIADLPGIPTMQELGLDNFESGGWYGLLAPADVSADVVRTLNRECVKALREPDVVARLSALGSFEDVAGSPEGFRKFIAAQIDKWRTVIEARGITAT